MKPTLLLIGPLVNRKNVNLTGGAIVLFQNLLEELEEQKIEYLLVDTNKKNYANKLWAYLSILGQIFWKQFRVKHLSLHSSQDYLLFMPYILGCAKLFNKTTSLRKFGGEAWESYRKAEGGRKKILNHIFKNTDFLFLEMQFLVDHFKPLNGNSFWFPNVRKEHNLHKQDKSFQKRFVFMSHVKATKGIDEIVKVCQQLDSSYTVDIYGVIEDENYSPLYFEQQQVCYKGVVPAHQVLEVLSHYDVLLLPSYKEGYPGIVIESYSLGLPIIATQLTGLKEITDQYQSGILIEPKNVQELKRAMEYFSSDNYAQFSKNAKNKFSIFNRKKQTKIFLDIISKKELVCKKYFFL